MWGGMGQRAEERFRIVDFGIGIFDLSKYCVLRSGKK